MRNLATLAVSMFAAIIQSCVSTTFEITTNEKAALYVAEEGKPGAVSQKLGETPFSAPAEVVQGKLLMVSAPGRPMAYLAIPAPSGTDSRIYLNLPQDAPNLDHKRIKDGPTSKERNIQMKLLMNAYKELVRENYRAAIELAVKADAIDQAVATPKIIEALAYLRQGDKQKANASLIQAKARDPEDPEIGRVADEM